MKKQAMHQPHQHRRTVWGRRCPSPAGHPKEGPSLDPSGGSLVCGEVAGWGGWNVTWHYELYFWGFWGHRICPWYQKSPAAVGRGRGPEQAGGQPGDPSVTGW